MIKFEEEVKRPANGPLTELKNNMQEVFSQYRKMRQYADYLEYELKQKDEHILKLENEDSFKRDERTTFDSNGNSVEPVIPQQSLPVMPEIVDDEIKRAKASNEPLGWSLENLEGLEDYNADKDPRTEKFKHWLFGDKEYHKNQELFARAWLDGYTVEKPQQFYLKHIDMSKRNSINDLYLKKYIHADLTENGEHRLSHAMSAKGIYPSKEYCAFTQQEIDSMQTWSYEQIEVEE